MFIGIATNNGLRKLRQERHGTIRLLQSDMPLLTELDSRGIASAINMPLLTELCPTGRPRQLRRSGMFIATGSPEHHQLRRSGMFIGTATNNDLRKLRQERHGTIRLVPNPTCRS